MVVYKTVDEYSRETGKKIGERKVFDKQLCDFSGKPIEEFGGNPVIYSVDYNDNDPCFGDHEAERWIYDWGKQNGRDDLDPDSNDWEEDNRIDPYELFGQTDYVFGTHENGMDMFEALLYAAKKQKFEIISLDHLFRWSRGRMLEKLFKEGKYKPEDFIQ